MGRSFVVLAFATALGVVIATTVIGMAVLWPDDRTIARPANLTATETERAKVTRVELATCPGSRAEDCRRVSARLETGPDEGDEVSFTSGGGVEFGVDDRVRLVKNPVPPGGALGGARIDPYAFSDFERGSPLLLLATLFAGLVIVAGRWQGLRALVGLVGSLAIVIGFVVPAILDGQPPTGVALVGALAVMLATIPLAHGFGAKTLAASLGTASALVLTVVLARFFSSLAHLSGASSEEAVFLRATQEGLSLQGLLLAGMVIGALGVLDDLTVTQASTVMALRRANAELGFGGLFRGALSVGHDHIAATVNTLVLAYAGAALPVLLVFSVADTSLADAASFEAVAEEIVATLVGSIGLIAAVPITTALAALLATHVRPSALADAHGH